MRKIPDICKIKIKRSPNTRAFFIGERMNIKELENLMMARYACRDFNDEKVTDEDIEKILKLARFCPSACNSQPWQLIYTTDKSKMGKITECLTDNGHNLFLEKAKGYIALIEQDAELKASISTRFSSTHFVKYDIGEMTAYITLIAKSMGIDTCIIGWINENINNVLGLEKDKKCNIVIALGRSNNEGKQKSRKEFKDIAKKL